ncbi:MAG TPA: glycosyltransferase [Coriobacteriia bacterium]|nr:glycosyltransferase [Coriobacteriia bacterium]
MQTLTVVIPALNEAQRLPRLLELLAQQTTPPDAVVVADAHSTDDTRALAEAAGAIVVDGGMPAVGRNAGAAVATTDLILFFDADNEPDPGWIELAVAEFQERELAVAAGRIEPVERDTANLFACDAANLYLELMQYVQPHAPGFCILVRRDVHERIGGFDETVVLAEDHDYVQRAADVGKFRVLRCPPMRTSMRRIEKEGIVGLAFKYLYTELHVIAGVPVREVPFDYEFAAFDTTKRETVPLALESARERLRDFGERLAELPTLADDHLKALGEATTPEAIETELKRLEPQELAALRHYVRDRVDYTRRLRPIVLRRMRRRGDELWQRIAAEVKR